MGMPAARLGDAGLPDCGPYVIATGSTSVSIDGRPAARVGDLTTPHPAKKFKCKPHISAITSGAGSVYIDGRPAAKFGSTVLLCTVIVSGSSSVFVE